MLFCETHDLVWEIISVSEKRIKNCIVKIIKNIFEKNDEGGLFPLNITKHQVFIQLSIKRDYNRFTPPLPYHAFGPGRAGHLPTVSRPPPQATDHVTSRGRLGSAGPGMRGQCRRECRAGCAPVRA